MKYEIFYLIGGSKESEVEKIKKEVGAIITEAGGVFEEKETQEKRKLSYKIQHETHGTYIAQRFELEDNQKTADINQKVGLNSGILRFILSRTEDLPELKTKEERMAEQEKRSASSAVSAEKTEKIKKENKEKKEISAQKPSKKETGKEDIDKKLEEILNI